jgi:hypothetical protein
VAAFLSKTSKAAISGSAAEGGGRAVLAHFQSGGGGSGGRGEQLTAVVIGDRDAGEACGIGQRDKLIVFVEMASACERFWRGRGATEFARSGVDRDPAGWLKDTTSFVERCQRTG